MPARTWFPVLNWITLPAFGQIHRLAPEEFENLYFSGHDSIQHMASCLFSGLKGEFPPNNVRIIGSPGIGKTTFLYYIKQLVKERKKSDPKLRAYLAIIDSDTILTGTDIDEGKIDAMIFEKTADYFHYIPEVRNHELVKEIFANSTLGPEDKTRQLWSFFNNNRELFTQRLFLALDGVDTLRDDQIIPVAVRIHNAVPHTFVRLWLTIRETRYNALGDLIRQQVDTLFQEPHKFPVVGLNKIIDARICACESTRGAGKNPFSPELCAFITGFYNGDLRRSLAMCGRLLQEIQPKDIDPSTDTSFIHRYVQRCAIAVLFDCEEIPNLYNIRQGAFRQFPLEKEVLMLLSAHPRIDVIFYDVLESELRVKLTQTEARISRSFGLEKSAIQNALTYLTKRGLIEVHGDDEITITSKGWEIQKIAETDYYMKMCRAASDGPRVYWDIAGITSNYQSLVLERLLQCSASGL